jgi:hypothetical protein
MARCRVCKRSQWQARQCGAKCYQRTRVRKVTSKAGRDLSSLACTWDRLGGFDEASEPREHQGLVFCSMQPRLHSSYLIFLTLPCRSPPDPSLHASNFLDPWEPVVLIACKTGVKSIQLCHQLSETRPEFYRTAYVGPRTPIGSTETDFPPPPKRTRLHLKTLIYLPHASHSPLRTVFVSLKNVFPSSTPETPHASAQRLTSTQPTPTRHPL